MDAYESETAVQARTDEPFEPARKTAPAPAPKARTTGEPRPEGEQPLVLEEVVIEEVSIDGMCGVY